MKKIFALLLVAFLSVTLVTGCGSKDEDTKEETKTETKEEENKKDNKKDDVGLITDSLICETKDADELDKIEVYYNGNKIVKLVESMGLESEEETETYVLLINSLYPGAATSNGNIVTATFTGDSLLDIIGEDEITTSKEELKLEFETEGYVCK